MSERGKTVEVSVDEHPRHGSTIETLAMLPLTFPKVEGHEGIITAGSASGITDGGAALVLASAAFAEARGLRPLATITGWASAGVDPRIMGIGPVPAIQEARQNAPGWASRISIWSSSTRRSLPRPWPCFGTCRSRPNG